MYAHLVKEKEVKDKKINYKELTNEMITCKLMIRNKLVGEERGRDGDEESVWTWAAAAGRRKKHERGDHSKAQLGNPVRGKEVLSGRRNRECDGIPERQWRRGGAV